MLVLGCVTGGGILGDGGLLLLLLLFSFIFLLFYFLLLLLVFVLVLVLVVARGAGGAASDPHIPLFRLAGFLPPS